MGRSFSITFGTYSALIVGSLLVTVFTGIIIGFVILANDDLLYAGEAILYMIIPIGFGLSLIGIGIKGLWGKLNDKSVDPNKYRKGGEYGPPFYEGKYNIVCQRCKARNVIRNPERSVTMKCKSCGVTISTTRRNNRTIQEGWNEKAHPCPKCKKAILHANSITPLYVVCQDCLSKIHIKDQKEKERPIKKGYLECPKCKTEISLSLRENDRLICPECGAKIKFVDT